MFILAQTTGSSKYQVVESSRLTWPDARSEATKKGLQLAVPQNIEEAVAIHSFMGKKGLGSYWLGISDTAHEGNWQDVHGHTVSYTKWKQGEPNGGKNENCVVTAAGTAEWNDVGCAAKLPYVMEPGMPNTYSSN